MIRPNFLSPTERLELESCVRSQREDHGIARRANALLLLDDGKSCQVIAEFLYLDDDTIRGWHKTYRESGWDALAADGWKGGQSRMAPDQEAALCDWLNGRFCRSTVEIRAHISTELGLRYSHSGCIKLLARLGFEYRKPKALPRGVSVEKQASFITMYERLMTELGTDEAVYFADAVHPEYQTKPAYGWVKAGSNPAVPTTAGRGRVNIHGGLNLETFDAPFVEPTTVDGVSATQLLAKIETRNPDKRLIHVIWDNAPYHKGPDVRAFLARPDCRIHLIQLPPYCPHLNPIERLWAVMHQLVTHNHHYPTQKQFANAILKFFRVTIPNEWKTFRSQVSDNFRVITHEKFRVLAQLRYRILIPALVIFGMACGGVAAQEAYYQGPQSMRGLYLRTDAITGAVTNDFLIARETLNSKKANDGKPVIALRFDFPQTMQMSPYRYVGAVTGHGEAMAGELDHIKAPNLEGLEPAASEMLFGEAGVIDSQDINMRLLASEFDNLQPGFTYPPEGYASLSVLAADPLQINFKDKEKSLDQIAYQKILLCESQEFAGDGVQRDAFRDNGPSCRHYTRYPSLANLIAETSTMEMMAFDYDQDIALIVSDIRFANDQISIFAAAFERQSVERPPGFTGWENWFANVGSVGQSRGPTVSCAIPAATASDLEGLEPGSVLLVRAKPISLSSTAASFECTPQVKMAQNR